MTSRFIRHVQSRPYLAVVIIFAFGIILPISIAQAIVPETPRRDLPIALDGEVWDVEKVGNTIVVAGNFTQVRTSLNGPVIDQAAIFAYDEDSGRFIDTFRPTIIGGARIAEIRDLEAADDGRSVYIGGRFTAIDDGTDGRVRTRNRLARLNVTDGRLDRNFAQAGVDAKVLTIELSRGLLYVGGNFLNVIDTAPGRPPILQSVAGLSRFDAITGAYDTTFRFESQENIGNEDPLTGERIGGVTRVAVNPAGNRLVVAHRGARMVNVNNGRSVEAGGVAILALGPSDSAWLSTFHALYPDPADPVQEFFNANQCNGRGVQIRDMEVSPDGRFFVLTSQGGDTGFQCDTITRFEITNEGTRPTWVSRAFDSVFSVGIADDAIYVGGHFRYLVSPTAPSAFPGDNGPNGVEVTRQFRQWYIADADGLVDGAVEFRQDLLDPGFVFRSRQLGALDPNTGFGIPTWDPGSDAAKGVLALTVTDRGLLLGQDNGRVNDINTGRAAFFDENPNVGNPRCRVNLNAQNRPVVSWTDIGDVQEWRVAANGTFLGATAGTSLVDDRSAAGTTNSYELRFNRNGIAQTDGCGTIDIPAPVAPVVPDITCTATRTGDNVQISWNDEPWGRVTVRRDGGWVATVSNVVSYTDDPGVGTYTYSVRGFLGGERVDTDCAPVTVAAAQLACTITRAGGTVSLQWNDVGAQSYQVRRDNRWVATVDAGTTSYSAPDEGGSYGIRFRSNGTATTVACA